jgi:hypothetical protein
MDASAAARVTVALEAYARQANDPEMEIMAAVIDYGLSGEQESCSKR